MATALETLATTPGGPRLVFLVSHVDALKARLGRALNITVGPSGSRVTNAPPKLLAASAARPPAPAPTTAAPPAAESAEADTVLGPDPENANNVYCEACRQSLRAAWATKHLASAKHAATLKRAASRR